MIRLGWCALVFSLLFSESMFALSLKCKRSLHVGESKNNICDDCGEPDATNSYYGYPTIDTGYEIVTQYFYNGQQQFPSYSVTNVTNNQSIYADRKILIDEWNYDFKHGRNRKLLRFENGYLKAIVNLPDTVH